MTSIKCFFISPTGETKNEQVFGEDGKLVGSAERVVYRRADTGEEKFLHEFPAGAMWFAEWLDFWTTPQLAHVMVVRTPGGDWTVDSQSSNCTRPARAGMKRQSDHHCWIIEGELPAITVSKNGNTCAAGAGSILMGEYHGFLRAGYLEHC